MQKIEWKEGSVINTRIDSGTVVISANSEGLLSLADHLIALVQESPGSHIHYDEYNSLEEGSQELIIEIIK